MTIAVRGPEWLQKEESESWKDAPRAGPASWHRVYAVAQACDRKGTGQGLLEVSAVTVLKYLTIFDHGPCLSILQIV